MRCARRPRLEVRQENHHCVPTHTSKAATHPATHLALTRPGCARATPQTLVPRAAPRRSARCATCPFFFFSFPASPLFSPPTGVFFAGACAQPSPAREHATACRSSTAVTSTASAIWPDNTSSRRLPPWDASKPPRRQTLPPKQQKTPRHKPFCRLPFSGSTHRESRPHASHPPMVPSTAGHAPLPSSPPTRQHTPAAD